MAYNRDTQVELKGTFEDSEGALTDPTEVTLQVCTPAGVVTSYLYSGGDVTRESQGVYTKAVTLDASGTWRYRFKGTGTLIVAKWAAITVLDDPFD